MSGILDPPPLGDLYGAGGRVEVERVACRRRLMVVRVTAGTAGIGALCAVLAAGCTGARTDHHPAVGTPVPTVAPTRAPAAVVAGDCALQGVSAHTATTEQGLVSVDPSASGLVILWVPGLNQRPCWAELVDSGSGVARRLAAAIDTAPATTPGTTACTAADNTGAELYFQYPGRPSERADVSLSGCEGVAAPGRDQRQLSDDLAASLLPLAPGAWRTRLPSA